MGEGREDDGKLVFIPNSGPDLYCCCTSVNISLRLNRKISMPRGTQ